VGVLKVVQDCARGEADTLLVHVYSVAAGADPAGAAAGALLTAGLLLLLLLLQIPHSCAAIAAHTAQLPPPPPLPALTRGLLLLDQLDECLPQPHRLEVQMPPGAGLGVVHQADALLDGVVVVDKDVDELLRLVGALGRGLAGRGGWVGVRVGG
jgi:hypothetical protein